jgi:hypothetical protein
MDDNLAQMLQDTRKAIDGVAEHANLDNEHSGDLAVIIGECTLMRIALDKLKERASVVYDKNNNPV